MYGANHTSSAERALGSLGGGPEAVGQGQGLGTGGGTGGHLGIAGLGEKTTDVPTPTSTLSHSLAHTHAPYAAQLTELQLVLVVPAATMGEVLRQREVKLAADYERRRAVAGEETRASKRTIQTNHNQH